MARYVPNADGWLESWTTAGRPIIVCSNMYNSPKCGNDICKGEINQANTHPVFCLYLEVHNTDTMYIIYIIYIIYSSSVYSSICLYINAIIKYIIVYYIWGISKPRIGQPVRGRICKVSSFNLRTDFNFIHQQHKMQYLFSTKSNAANVIVHGAASVWKPVLRDGFGNVWHCTQV